MAQVERERKLRGVRGKAVATRSGATGGAGRRTTTKEPTGIPVWNHAPATPAPWMEGTRLQGNGPGGPLPCGGELTMPATRVLVAQA